MSLDMFLCVIVIEDLLNVGLHVRLLSSGVIDEVLGVLLVV